MKTKRRRTVQPSLRVSVGRVARAAGALGSRSRFRSLPCSLLGGLWGRSSWLPEGATLSSLHENKQALRTLICIYSDAWINLFSKTASAEPQLPLKI